MRVVPIDAGTSAPSTAPQPLNTTAALLGEPFHDPPAGPARAAGHDRDLPRDPPIDSPMLRNIAPQRESSGAVPERAENGVAAPARGHAVHASCLSIAAASSRSGVSKPSVKAS